MTQQSTEDTTTDPVHYTEFEIEPLLFVVKNKLDFCQGSIIKYVSRAGLKLYPGLDKDQSAIRDYRKVIRYAQAKINEHEGNEEI